MGGGLSEERKNDYCYWGKGPYGKEPYGERTIGGGGRTKGLLTLKIFWLTSILAFTLSCFLVFQVDAKKTEKTKTKAGEEPEPRPPSTDQLLFFDEEGIVANK